MIKIDIENPKACIDCLFYINEGMTCRLGVQIPYIDDSEYKSDKCPIVEVVDTIEERQKGIWRHKKITDDCRITGQCSVCGERSRLNKFCPYCGARMTTAEEKDNNVAN